METFHTTASQDFSLYYFINFTSFRRNSFFGNNCHFILFHFSLVRKDQATILYNVQVLANIPSSKRNNTDFSPFYSQKECQIHATKSQFVSEPGLCVLPISHPNAVTADLICCTLVQQQRRISSGRRRGKLRQRFVYRKCSYCPLHAAAGMHHAREKTPKHRLSCDESASHC